MFEITSSDSSQKSTDNNPKFGPNFEDQAGELDWCIYQGEYESRESLTKEVPCPKCIKIGDYLPFGCSLYYNTDEKLRLKDVGERRRILLLGVIGSFTPYCWNRHLFRVLKKTRYYAERGIDYICCVSTNDPYTHTAWGSHLGCEDSIFMLSDVTYELTKLLGMDTVIPWLDNNIRSKRYLIYAENMEVTKMIVSHDDGPHINWKCEHLQPESVNGELDTEESDVDLWI